MKFKIIHRYWAHGKVLGFEDKFKTYSEGLKAFTKLKNEFTSFHFEVRLINLQTNKTSFEYRSW